MAPRPARQRTHAAAAGPRPPVQVGKLITKTEIPAFIPRGDLMDQLVRCARAGAPAAGSSTRVAGRAAPRCALLADPPWPDGAGRECAAGGPTLRSRRTAWPTWACPARCAKERGAQRTGGSGSGAGAWWGGRGRGGAAAKPLLAGHRPLARLAAQLASFTHQPATHPPSPPLPARPVPSRLKVAPYYREGLLWGFTVSFLKDGASANDVRVAFDEEVTLKHEWVGRGAGAFTDAWAGKGPGARPGAAQSQHGRAGARGARPRQGEEGLLLPPE